MSEFGPIYDGLEEALSKVYLLRDSCAAIYEQGMDKGTYRPSEVWFDGARIVLGEVVSRLNDGIDHMEGLIRSERKKEGGADE